MQYVQMPLPDEKPMTVKAWADMGATPMLCPGCGQYLMYTSNLACYACVCSCGWVCTPGSEGYVVWYHPSVVEAAVQRAFIRRHIQN